MVIRIIIIGECIIIASGQLQGGIEIRDIHRSAKHEVFKEMGKSGKSGIFVARANVIQNVHGNHG